MQQGQLSQPKLEQMVFNSIPIWTDDTLYAATGVRIAFTGRAGGISPAPYDSLNLGPYVDDDPENVQQNLAIALKALGADGMPCVTPKQVHGTHIEVATSVATVPAIKAAVQEGADAVVVTVPDIAAQLSFADCLPLTIVSPTGHFAVVHAGWRGALAGIAGIALKALMEQAENQGMSPSDCNAYIGPYIHEECFETSEDVRQQFIGRYGQSVVGESGNVSLARVVAQGLKQAGFDAARIADVDICTVCHAGEYFSFRASGGICGRQGALAFRHAR